MILTAHQPVYIPWLGLFHKIMLADQFVSFNQVQYQPKDWNNRNRIKSAKGDIWLTVPVLKKGYLHSNISDIEINNNLPWRRKHWKSILTNYRDTPFFSTYSDFFEDVYKRDWKKLVDLNEYMLKWFLDQLGIKTKFESAKNFDFVGKKQDLVLDMCLKLGANTYIFGAQGKDYADVQKFLDAGVKPVFQDYKCPVYTQSFGAFSKCLSILDLIFNCGNDSLDVVMRDNIRRVSN